MLILTQFYFPTGWSRTERTSRRSRSQGRQSEFKLVLITTGFKLFSVICWLCLSFWPVLSIVIIGYVLSILSCRGLKVLEEFLAFLGPKEIRYVLSCNHKVYFSKWLLTCNKTLENNEVAARMWLFLRDSVFLCVTLGLARCGWPWWDTWNAWNKGSCVI